MNGKSKPCVGHRAKFISRTRPHVIVFGRLIGSRLRLSRLQIADTSTLDCKISSLYSNMTLNDTVE